MTQQRTVLSIDGGGIRGIIPAMILHHIETATGRPAAELFDLMVGTSTGGILALGLAQPDVHSSHHSRYRARDLADLYAQRGSDIFSRSLWRRLRSVGGIFDESYPAGPLEGLLNEYFGDNRLGLCRCPTIVTAYDIEDSQTVFIKSFKPEHRDLSCSAAARATSAAPTFFEPARMQLHRQESALIDGGVFINSPVVSAYAEALKLFPGDPITVISLGTGQLTRSIAGDKAARWGKAGWLMPVLDCVFDGVARAADYQMNLFLGERYQRFQLDLNDASDALDDTSPANIAALFSAAADLIDGERSRLDNIVAYLRMLHGFPPLMQQVIDTDRF
ncbi:MAG: patatin-like phospholipase family protein [Luminiphilus sp.]|nr:patatin-like phospholipase family protein [Luminiphilus sp.]